MFRQLPVRADVMQESRQGLAPDGMPGGGAAVEVEFAADEEDVAAGVEEVVAPGVERTVAEDNNELALDGAALAADNSELASDGTALAADKSELKPVVSWALTPRKAMTRTKQTTLVANMAVTREWREGGRGRCEVR